MADWLVVDDRVRSALSSGTRLILQPGVYLGPVLYPGARTVPAVGVIQNYGFLLPLAESLYDDGAVVYVAVAEDIAFGAFVT